MSFALSMLVALGLDVVIGWPDRLYQRIGHPVTWMGALVTQVDARWNRDDRSDPARLWWGALATACVVGVTTVLAVGLVALVPSGWIGAVIAGVLAWPLVAARAMETHVRAVLRPLTRGNLAGARQAVAMIVGRDPSELDTPGVARATLESLAENTSDGIVAPLFWGVVAGLPGIAAYKAINTLDSMIGHRNSRYLYFGRVAARLDDIVNLIPARLTGLLFGLTSGRARAALRVMVRDARQHRSPNAGWPEAAMAGALAVRLSGPRSYGGVQTRDPFVNAGHPDPAARDIARGLVLFRRSMLCLAGGLALLALL